MNFAAFGGLGSGIVTRMPFQATEKSEDFLQLILKIASLPGILCNYFLLLFASVCGAEYALFFTFSYNGWKGLSRSTITFIAPVLFHFRQR